MRTYNKIIQFSLITIFLIFSGGFAAEFFDDFNDNIFDTTMWATWFGISHVGDLEEADSVLQLRLPPE